MSAWPWWAVFGLLVLGCGSRDNAATQAPVDHSQHGGAQPSGQRAGVQHSSPHAGHTEDVEPGALAPGHAPVLLDPARLQALGVKTGRVQRRSFTRDIEIDEDGSVYTSISNFPAWQIEEGQPMLIHLRDTAENLATP